MEVAVYLSAAIWLGIFFWPVRPWGTRESIQATRPAAEPGRLTAVIPARNEAGNIERCLQSVLNQGPDVHVIVVDDGSEDGTARQVTAVRLSRVKLVAGEPLAEGWTGKLWAVHQGVAHVDTEHILLLDADIVLAPGIVADLRQRLDDQRLGMISIMARLRMSGFWERLLLPAYVYFFKMLYPFAMVNAIHHNVAAAAGGCILIRSKALQEIGGFASMRNALIDDCTLAACVKRAGWPVHIALSHDVRSLRPYTRLAQLWRLVTRTAFSQLNHSLIRLLGCTTIMVGLFLMPVVALFPGEAASQWVGTIGYTIMALTQFPVLIYYDLNPLRALLLPPVAILFLLMTWHSAWRQWRGGGAIWKGRAYNGDGGSPPQEPDR